MEDKELTPAEQHLEHLRKLKEDPQYKEEYLKQRELDRQAHWLQLKPFQVAHDVPTLPNPLTQFYLDRLVQLGAIPLKDLVDGQWYYGDYRNAHLGRWDAHQQVFHHLRYKWGYRWDNANHFEHDNMFALFTPLRLATLDEIEAEIALAPTNI